MNTEHWIRFDALLDRLKTLNYSMNVMRWDAETGAPHSGMEARSEALAFLSGLYYQTLAAPEVADLITFLEEDLTRRNEGDVDSDIWVKKAKIRKFKREFEAITKIPENEYTEYVKLTSKATIVWEQAKHKNDFTAFAPYLEDIIGCIRKFAVYRGGLPGRLYDVYLEDYEPGMTMDKYDVFFDTLRKGIVPLVGKVSEASATNDLTFLNQDYGKNGQKELAENILRTIGFDLERGMLAESEHPFTLTLAPEDVRLTTHFYPDNVLSSFFSSAHEGGHGIYEQCCDQELVGRYLAEGASSGIHESQSRLYENGLCRSPHFWKGYFGKLQALFPEQLKNVTHEQFVKAVNHVKPSFIRVEADELTYSLHVMIRYEIERDLIEGKVEVSELPKIWNDKMKSYLGITPPTDTLGVLQDTHWSNGLFGYFPTYALGNAYAAQILKAMEKDIEVGELLEKGEFLPIRKWLTEKIHRFGMGKTPEELMVIATHEPLDASYYVDYLREKFSTIHGLVL